VALLQGRRPDPPPLETDDVRTVAVGTALWGVALVVLALLSVTDATRVESWWLATCACGLVLGLAGVQYCRRRRDAIERDKAKGLPQRE
jgi:peptidoglycan/LPS O-acetylase OafA/YrhL